MTEGKDKDPKREFYKAMDWEAHGDAFRKSRPRLDHQYRCENCGESVQVKGDCMPDSERKRRREPVTEVIVECPSCRQVFLTLVDTRLLPKRGTQ